MSKPKPIWQVFLFIFAFAAGSAFAQEAPLEATSDTKASSPLLATPSAPLAAARAEPSYDVVLQTLVASNAAGDKTVLPSALAAVVKKLRTDFSQADYKLTATYVQRVANTGNVEFKSIANQPKGDASVPVFSEWSLTQLKNSGQSEGALQMGNFRFNQRIPVKTGNYRDENGKTSQVINYEAIGLTLQKLSLRENVPTVVGSLSTANPGEMMFLILTVRASEN